MEDAEEGCELEVEIEGSSMYTIKCKKMSQERCASYRFDFYGYIQSLGITALVIAE